MNLGTKQLSEFSGNSLARIDGEEGWRGWKLVTVAHISWPTICYSVACREGDEVNGWGGGCDIHLESISEMRKQ